MTHIFPFCSVWYLLLKREVLFHRHLRCRASPSRQGNTFGSPQGRDTKLWRAKKHGCQPSWEEACLVLVDGDMYEEIADQTEEVGRRHKEAKYGALDVSLSLFWGGIYVSFEKYCWNEKGKCVKNRVCLKYRKYWMPHREILGRVPRLGCSL